MKIDEPKTPFAPQYDPAQDEEEMKRAEMEDALLNAKGLVVDELDDKSKKKEGESRGMPEEEIPSFELGEPEEAAPPPTTTNAAGDRIVRSRSHSGDEKRVDVGADDSDKRMTPAEYEEKHREFEERRKKHYEMKDVKNLLAYGFHSPDTIRKRTDPFPSSHPEHLDEIDEDEGESDNDSKPKQPPAVPKIPERFLNGKK